LEKHTKERIPDDPKIITCSLDNTIRLWDARDMHVTTVMESPENAEISCMTFLTNCCLVATGHEDGSIRLWNMEINSHVTLKCEEIHRHKNSISCILGAFHKDSEFLMCGSYDGKVSIWEISEKKSTSANTMLSSTIFPQLKMVIDNTKIPEKNERRAPAEGEYRYFEEEKQFFAGTEILCLQFYAEQEDPLSTDAAKQRGHGYVVVGGSDKKINIWNIRTYDHVAQLRGHFDSITSMAIDAKMLFTGSDDMSIGIWNLLSFYNVGFLHGHKDSKKIGFKLV
jgi:WD40 repeat protein